MARKRVLGISELAQGLKDPTRNRQNHQLFFDEDEDEEENQSDNC